MTLYYILGIKRDNGGVNESKKNRNSTFQLCTFHLLLGRLSSFLYIYLLSMWCCSTFLFPLLPFLTLIILWEEGERRRKNRILSLFQQYPTLHIYGGTHFISSLFCISICTMEIIRISIREEMHTGIEKKADNSPRETPETLPIHRAVIQMHKSMSKNGKGKKGYK